MIEKYLYDYLNSVLSVPVYMERRANGPDSFVIIEKTGGSAETGIKHAVIAVQSYAPSLYGAASLSSDVVDAMEEAVTVDEITAVQLNSEYNFTKTDSKEYRYQAVFEITYY